MTPSLIIVVAGGRFRWCALCGNEPVPRPDLSPGLVEGRFCPDCVAARLADTSRAHWCAVDTVGRGDDS